MSSSVKLDKVNLAGYEAAGLLLDETKKQKRGSSRHGGSRGGSTVSKLVVVPPSPLPTTGVGKTRRQRAGTIRQQRAEALPLVAEALVIQIVPHDNGEVFLSKRAADQDPDFFGSRFPDEQHQRNRQIQHIRKENLIPL